MKYNLNVFKDNFNFNNEFKKAIFSFMVSVAYLNVVKNEKQNYVMLVHTSYKKNIHYGDMKSIEKILGVLKNYNENKKYLEQIFLIIKKRFSKVNDEEIRKILEFISDNFEGSFYKIINSDEKNKDSYIDKLTKPIQPFTIVIWGNILSRDLTFDNLLSMFFLRTTKSWKLQQDTYIQMARMFWNRDWYLEYFELNISEPIYVSWWECFNNHRISFNLLRSGKKPVWVESEKSSSTSSTSIDKKRTLKESVYLDDNDVTLYKCWEWWTSKFSYSKDIKNIL